MYILVIDQGPEFFWFVSNVFIKYEYLLKHATTIQAAEKLIKQEVPAIVIMSGDDKTLMPEVFINKIKNTAFINDPLFIVITANTTLEFKKLLLKAGAGQIFYRNKENDLEADDLAKAVHWFLKFKNPDDEITNNDTALFPSESVISTFDRMGWISDTHCLIETNLNLKIEQVIEAKGLLFKELGMEDVKLTCVEKNTYGKYYNYSHGYVFKISTRETLKDSRIINAWIKNNQELSKSKPIKVVYFEKDPKIQEEILSVLEAEGNFSAKGFSSLDSIKSILASQLPNLIIINRDLVWSDQKNFDAIFKFYNNYFSYCVTYSQSEKDNIKEIKKKYGFATHSRDNIDRPMLESMIKMLMAKLPKRLIPDDSKMYLPKDSAYSFVNLIFPCKIKEISTGGIVLNLELSIDNFNLCEISNHSFTHLGINRIQQLRVFLKKNFNKELHSGDFQLNFVGQSQRDRDLITDAINFITENGFDVWKNNG